MTHPLDPSAPLRSLRAIAGIGGVPLSPTGLAVARGVKAPTVHDAERAGAGISVATLRAYVEALGGALAVIVRFGAREVEMSSENTDGASVATLARITFGLGGTLEIRVTLPGDKSTPDRK